MKYSFKFRLEIGIRFTHVSLETMRFANRNLRNILFNNFWCGKIRDLFADTLRPASARPLRFASPDLAGAEDGLRSA